MQFAGDCSPDQHATMIGLLRRLDKEVPGVRSLTVGPHELTNSPTPAVAVVADFDTVEDLEAYTHDPYHLSVGEYFGGIRGSVAIVDMHVDDV